MANRPLTMNKIKQILRSHFEGHGSKQLSKMTGVSRNTVKCYLRRFQETGMHHFGIQPLDVQSRMLLLELIDDRHGKKSTIITSQLPVSAWYEIIGDHTLADAILDRIAHDAHPIELQGESLRKQRKINPENL